jgi:phosphohistidine phosphatase
MVGMDRAHRLLVIVRHAKTESGEEGSDHDRRLTSRGVRDATATGRWLAGQVDSVDHAWVSSATRAAQTWAALRAALPAVAHEDVSRDLYLAGPREVVEQVTSNDAAVQVIVGHNPAMEQALMTLTGDLHGLRPGAAAIVELTGERGRLVELHTPER